MAAPATYAVDGEQYVAVSAGWGTAFGLIAPGRQVTRSRMIVFKLGGDAKLPVAKIEPDNWPTPVKFTGTPKQVAHGKELYLTRCFMCHGDAAISGGALPDLRLLDKDKHDAWHSVGARRACSRTARCRASSTS